MPKSVNKVILVGNVGKDPEVRYTPGGTPVANFSLATHEKLKDRNDEWQERTEWHSIVVWQRLAEIVGEYVAKGSKVYVEGKLQTSSWEDRQSGERKYGLKSSPASYYYSALGIRAAATIKTRPTTRMKARLLALAPAKLWKTFHSERLRNPYCKLMKGELS